MTKFLTDQPDANPLAHLALAHGAGAPMDHPFMETVAAGIAASGIMVSRFEFPYMAMRRVDGKRRGPGGQKKMLETWRDVIRELSGDLPLFIGGKSMGGRIASMVADEPGVAGIICLGYPFHPPGKPEKLRTGHLEAMPLPMLVVQGERDPFGGREEVEGYKLSKTIEIVWLPDGDHSFKPRKKSGHTEDDNLRAAIDAVAGFIAGNIARPPRGS